MMQKELLVNVQMCMPEKHYGQKKIAQSTLLSWRRLVTCQQSNPLICLEGTSIAMLFSAHPSLASSDCIHRRETLVSNFRKSNWAKLCMKTIKITYFSARKKKYSIQHLYSN